MSTTHHKERMNIGFLFLTYDDIIHEETKKFVKNYSVYVNAKNPSKIVNNTNYSISNYPTEWGKKNIVDATLKMLENAYKNGHSWFVLLAYDSLPLIRPIELETFLKYQTKSLFHLIENNDVEWKTSQWWILSRADVETILKNKVNYDKYLKTNPFKDIKGAWDEIYFLSLLKYVDPAYMYREYKTTYVKWLTKSVQKHPVTYGKLLPTDMEECKKSFFIRKTTTALKHIEYTPNKILYIKIYGTKTHKSFSIPPETDLMLISLVKNDEIPEKILNQSIHTYFSIFKFLPNTILEVLDVIPTYLWNNIYILNETTDEVNKSKSPNNKENVKETIVELINNFKNTQIEQQPLYEMAPITLPNPPQFYKLNKGCYKYSPNKIAFLFLTIGDINQPNIWTKYLENKENKYSIYINSKYPETIQTIWLKNKLIKNNVVDTEWGIITKAYHNLLEEAIKDKDNMKFVFISESCIPLKTFDKFYEKMMEDDIRTSYIKFMTPSLYDKRERIEKYVGHKEHKPFIKHYARMCLSRYHAEKLLEKDFGFFNNMKVGDEFFLTLIHPKPNIDYVKDFEITYDNWEDVNKTDAELTEQIKDLKNRTNKRSINMLRRKRAIRNSIRKNPITYTKISTYDLERATKKESFFWRKFPNGTLPWTPELLNIVSSGMSSKQLNNDTEPNKTQKKTRKNTNNTRKNKNKNGIAI